jgi:hypothetical protein
MNFSDTARLVYKGMPSFFPLLYLILDFIEVLWSVWIGLLPVSSVAVSSMV